MPQLKGIQWLMWILFIISVPMRFWTGTLAFTALVVGLLRRGGVPKFSTDYLRGIMFDENF